MLPARRTNSSFQHLCTPALMRSFITSYESATLWKTSPTRAAFSCSGTVAKPKCVVVLPLEEPEESARRGEARQRGSAHRKTRGAGK
jgi:hypothetical protein